VIVFAVLLGLIWGSFANVCIYRWPPSEEHPKGRSVVQPGSHCGACKAPIRWYDNVPILSFVWLRGKCRACGVAFSPRYVLVEAVTAALFGVAWWFAFGDVGLVFDFDVRALRFAIYSAFCFVMVVVTFIDIDHKLILNKIMIPSIPVAYAASLLDHVWWHGLVGAAVGYGVPWLIGEIFYRVTGKDALGLGDSMLLAVIGALLGWKGVFVALFGGSVLGVLVSLVVLIRARKRVFGTEVPFGPFLAAAAVFYLFAEPWLELQFLLLQ
jgi:leader peptidase (prepilin peptidase)/N-methyltransferase